MAPKTVSAEQHVWDDIAEEVRRQRLRTGLTVEDVVARSAAAGGRGVSRATVSLIENGRQTSYAERSLRALSIGLGWTPDSIERMLVGRVPATIDDAIAEVRETLRYAESSSARGSEGAREMRLSATRQLRELEALADAVAAASEPLEGRDSPPVATVPGSFTERANDALRQIINELLVDLSHPNVYGAVVALVWLKGRDLYGPDSGEWAEGRDGDVGPSWQDLVPSLDELMWATPDLGDLEDVILGQWRQARHRWDDAVQDAATAVPSDADTDLNDIEDHAMAAQSGENPTGVKKGPKVSRPSPEPEADDWA